MSDRRFPLSRRQVLSLGAGAFVLAAIPLAVARRRRALVRRQLPLMGTIAEVAVVHDDPVRAQAALDSAFARLAEVERAMTRYADDSDVGRANLEAAARAVEVGRETALVVAEALRWAEGTRGAFDPCIGGAVAAWDVGHRREPLPAEEVARWADRRLWRSCEVTRALGAPAIRFADRDASLDLGAIAKGYAVDRAVEALRSAGVERGLVNVGGDLYALGHREDAEPWEVGVQSPWAPGEVVETVSVADAAVATSGVYLRGFDHRGRRYHHLLDPATATPWNGRRSLTIVARDCMTADAASTAVYGLDDASAARALASLAPSARMAHSA